MKKLNKQQAIIISGYTGITCCAFNHIHEDIEKRLGRPVMTHEMGTNSFRDEIREVYKADFLALVYEDGK